MSGYISKLFPSDSTIQHRSLPNRDINNPYRTDQSHPPQNYAFDIPVRSASAPIYNELTIFLETNHLKHKSQILREEGFDITSLAVLTPMDLNKLGFSHDDQINLQKGLVRYYLKSAGLPQYEKLVESKTISELANSNLNDLEGLGIKPLGHRIRILSTLALVHILLTSMSKSTIQNSTPSTVPVFESPFNTRDLSEVSWEKLTGTWFNEDNTFGLRIQNEHLYDNSMQSFYGPSKLEGNFITSFKASSSTDFWESFEAKVELDKLIVSLKEKDKGQITKYILEKRTPPYPVPYWASYYNRETACGMLTGAAMLGAEKRTEAILATIAKEPKLAKVINTRKEVWTKESVLDRQMKNQPYPFPDDYVFEEEEQSDVEPTLNDLVGIWVDSQSTNNVWELTKTFKLTSISFLFTPVVLNGREITTEYVEFGKNELYWQVVGHVINKDTIKFKITSHIQVEDDIPEDSNFVSETKEILMKKGTSMMPCYCLLDRMDSAGYSWSLITACSVGSIKSVEAMLNNLPSTFDVNERREEMDGNTIFYSFANIYHSNTSNIFDITRILLARGADYKVYGTKGSILHAACGLNNYRFVKILIELGCDPNEWYSDKPVSPFWDACSRGNEELAEILAEGGADILVECEGQKALYNIPGGSVGVRLAEMMINKGHPLNTPLDEYNNTILHRAVDKKDVTLIEGLLALGADPDIVNQRGTTPRSNAGTRDIKKLFIHPDFYSIIELIGKNDDKELTNLLQRNKTDPSRPDAENASDPMGWSILMYSCLLAHWKCAEAILKFNPDKSYYNEFNLNADTCAKVSFTSSKTGPTPEANNITSQLRNIQQRHVDAIQEAYKTSDRDGKILLTWGEDVVPLLKGAPGSSSRRNGRGNGLQTRMEDGIPDVIETSVTSEFYSTDYKPPSLWDFLIGLTEDEIPNSFADKSRLLLDSKLFVLGRTTSEIKSNPKNMCVIYLYTVECDIYKLCNRAMRTMDQKGIRTWRPFIYYLINALQELPSSRHIVYRGIGIPFDINLYSPGKKVTWLSFSSTSSATTVATSFLSSSKGIVFMIQARTGKEIEFYSQFPGEKEILFSSKTQFVVTGLYRTKDYNLMGKAISPKEANNYDKIIITMTEVEPE